MRERFGLLCLLVLAAVGRCPIARAQPFASAPDSLRVMTWNVEWMYDDYKGDNRSKLAKEQSAPSKKYWNAKVGGVAKVLADAQPDIVALQEIEGAQTLREIAAKLNSEHKLAYRFAFIQGADTFTEQDVGFLVRSGLENGLVSYRRHEQTKAMYDSREYHNVSKHLVGEFRWEGMERPMNVMTVHLRATADAEEPRVKQAKLARKWLEPNLSRGEDVILLGDLNSEHSAGSIQGDIAAIVGENGPKMVDLLEYLDDKSAQTHLVLDKQFDRILVSESLMDDTAGEDWVFDHIEILVDPIIRGKRDSEEHWSERLTMSEDELDLSDHFPVMATFLLK